MRHLLTIVFSLFLLHNVHSQEQSIPNKDTLRFLLSDIKVQVTATEAINNMYNFKFEKSEQQFQRMKNEYYWHPLPHFLLGLNTWWRIIPSDDISIYDDAFIGYMNAAIHQAELIGRIPAYMVESSFFLAASYSLKARFHADRGNWRKAISNTTASLNHLDVSKSIDNRLSPELLFGDGLYNYYVEWIPENYPILKPVMAFFQKGNKELGIKQLGIAANNAFYTRTEAQFFLMRILTYEESPPGQALEMAKYLHKTFPDNSYFHRYYARLLYSSNHYPKALEVSYNCLAKIDSGYTGYENVTGRYCCFFLAQIKESYNQLDEAKHYYQRAIDFAEKGKDLKAGYYLFSMVKLGRLYQKEKNKKKAKYYYKLVKKRAKRKHSAYSLARKYMKEL